MIEFDEYKVKLNNIRPKLDALSDSLGIEAAKEEIERLHAQIDSDGFWDNQEVSQKVMKQSRQLESKVELYERMCSQWDDLYTLCEMAIEEGDDSMLPELTEGYAQLEQEMEKARLETLLSGEYDNNNAIVSFQAGAGGTEAQDWASMLYRMYTHWTEQHDPRLPRRRRGGHQIRQHPHRGRERLRPAQERKRRSPPRARVSVRRQRPAADLVCRGRGHPRDHR